MKKKALIALAGLAVVATLAGCSSSGGSGGSASAVPATDKPQAQADKPTNCDNKIIYPDATRVSLWGWSPTLPVAVDAFDNAHKDVQICWTNAGAGAAEYQKFSTAISAGKGAPDVVMLETDHLNSFLIKDALVNLSDYGADKWKSDFSAGTLKDISSNGSIYAIPDDGGPVAMMYRKDIFDKYGLTPPTTWAEYASDAAKLKAAGGPAMGDWPNDTPAFTQAMFIQAGADPFSYNIDKKTELGVDINTAATRKVLNYWDGLVKSGEVVTTGQSSTDFVSDLSSGKLATFIAASWEPGHLTGAGFPKGANSPWRVAMLPQWDSSSAIQTNWGGSTYAVSTQSKVPHAAAEVALNLFGNENADLLGAHFPQHLKAQKAPWFVNAQDPFFGGQQANKEVWIPTADAYKGQGYSPFQDYYYQQVTAMLTKTTGGDQSASAGLASLQSTVDSYAKSQGFTVKTK
ncbi:sugar ABC transporter substrate-binding protein [Humibacter soli]